MIDILITEQNSGGDLSFRNGDLVPAVLYENMIYMAMFGGTDYFMDDLTAGDESTKYNCLTEKTCNETTLNSAGRAVIEAAVVADLQFLKDNIPGSTLDVKVIIISDDKVQIDVTFNGILYTYSYSTNETSSEYISGSSAYSDGYSDGYA